MGGAHVAARLVRAPTPPLLILLVLLSSCAFMSFAATDADALLKLKDSLANTTALSNWNPSIFPPCSGNRGNWVGVLCWNNNIWGLRLENMGLSGVIDVDSLIQLPYLRKLGFRNNNLDGPFPHINKLVSLKSLFLSHNHFSGEIPDDAFVGMTHFKKVYLSNNLFSGQIPSSLTTLPKLLEVRLDGNQFEGHIPDFKQQLRFLNVSNNQLEGPIPAALGNMDSSSFSGNENVCGKPLDACEISKSKKHLVLKTIIIVIVVGLVLMGIGVIAILLCKRKQKSLLDESPSFGDQNNKPASYANQAVAQKLPERSGSMKRGANGKLSFVRDDRERFDLQDLLRASAEVLGSGTFGASYKAVTLNGQALVVKRYKQMSIIGREDFHEHMRRLGRLRHPNLLPLVAYYYRKEEKLLVFDFVQNGSLASHLHGNHTKDRPGLDWPTRLQIIKGVVKGLAYLYSELPSLTVPHGHLKSSNVVLQESFDPLLTDYALLPMINIDDAQHVMIAYKSPEHLQQGQPTKKTDIWSLGILILEVLTGKFPENYLMPSFDSNADLATWVNSMVKEKRMDEVFDKEMEGTKDCKGKMIQLLKIGLSCCEEDVETRLDLKEVVEKIEELNEGDIDEDQLPTNISGKRDAYEFIEM